MGEVGRKARGETERQSQLAEDQYFLGDAILWERGSRVTEAVTQNLQENCPISL